MAPKFGEESFEEECRLLSANFCLLIPAFESSLILFFPKPLSSKLSPVREVYQAIVVDILR
jgi:hypothetical protein